MQEKYLPIGIEIKIRLNRASPRFCILSEDPCVVKIDGAALEVRHIQLLPAISNEVIQSFAHHNAKFPIRRVGQKFHDWQWTSIKSRRSFVPGTASKTYLYWNGHQ